MSDEMIRALAGNGGVIMINFGSSFITEEANRYTAARGDAEKAYKAEHPDATENFLDEEFPKIYAAEHGPFPYASLEEVLLHFEHVIQLVGVDYVGIGSDYDGVGDSLPTGLKDVSTYPALVQGPLSRGYSEAEISKILGENLLRVWGVVAEYAAGTGHGQQGSS
jgi:membrane dipeptidase